MKKRLLCLAVSLIMVIQMLAGWSAFAADAAEGVHVPGEYPPDTEMGTTGDALFPDECPPNVEAGSPQEEVIIPPLTDDRDVSVWYAAGTPVSNRVPTENTVFATDLFCVETVAGDGKTYRLEHWDPKGQNGLCLWTGVVSLANPSNGGWKLKPASGGHYYLIGASTVLTAADDGAVVVATLTNDSSQQWDLVPVQDGDGVNCKIVNVKYQTELAYTDPAADRSIIRLVSAGQGAVWAFQNLSQGSGDTFLTAGPSVPGSDRVPTSNNFATDYFTLEIADGTYQVEHYMADGSPSLWNAYSTTVGNGGNGGWKLTPVKGGYYCITTNKNQALAAVNNSVVVWNQSPNQDDKAQQWKLVPDESTADPSDCKIVNAEYNTQLAYAKPAANDAKLTLDANGDGWIVRNLRQSEALGGFVAYVAPGDSEYVDWGELSAIAVTGPRGEVDPDPAYDGPQITKVRVINEGQFLEIYWDRYVDEVQAVNVDNFVLKNGDRVIKLEAKKSGADAYTNTLYFDKENMEVAGSEGNCMSRLSDDLHMSSIYYYFDENETNKSIDPNLGLTLEVKGGAIKDRQGKAAKNASYQNVPKVNYYTQEVVSETGIVVKADETVARSSMELAAKIVDVELSRTETGIAANMKKYGCSLAVYSPHQNAYFIPEHRTGFRLSMYDVEGYGGSIYNNCVSSIAERNILRTRGNTEDPALNTGYPDESVLIHEFGHCIKSVGIELLEDQTLADELFAAYENAKDSGLWPNTYRISNSDEYFATMCTVWFNVMNEVDNWNDGTRCPLNTREEMRKYDPQTYAFFEKILPPAGTKLPAPWDEEAPDIYHDEYVNPDPLSNQVEAIDSNFETDLFKLRASARGEFKMIERYTPEGAQEGEVCLWSEYNDSPEITGDDGQKWPYYVVKTAEGNLRFVVANGDVDGTGHGALTATSASTVSVMGCAPSDTDPAQQWKFVEDASTVSKFDGKLVNVLYGTELSYTKPFSDGSIVTLMPTGEGGRWFVRNATQSNRVRKDAYLKPDAVATPTASPNGSTFATDQTVILSCATEGAKIYYTTDGSTPTVSSTEYNAPITLTATTSLRAIAVKEGMVDSAVLTASYIKTSVPVVETVAAPVAVPNGGTFVTSQTVTLTCATEGASIYYTLDGSVPTTDSVLYTGPFTLYNSTDLRAIAVKAGMVNSAELTLRFTCSTYVPVDPDPQPDDSDEPDDYEPPMSGNGTTGTKPPSQGTNTGTATTTTRPDGSTMTVKKEGSTTITTIEQTDGSVGMTTEAANGKVSAQVTLSQAAVSVAGRAYLPLPEIPALRSSAAAATVTINTSATEPVAVSIPVKGSSSGTVAILVRADGTEEILRTSIVDNGALSLTVPAGGAVVKVVENSKSFPDTDSHWGVDAVAFVTARDLFNGTSDSAFSPDTVMTRGMLMTVLAQLDGEDTSSGGVWYEKGMEWAKRKDISDGTLPEKGLTRQELATVLYRYAGRPAVSGNLNSFPDGASTAQWAEQAMIWAVENGIICGMESGTLNPQGPATRAQVATVLMRFVALIAK